MSDEPVKKPREIIVINRKESQPKDRWDTAERLSRILSLAAIPVVLAFVGWWIQGELQNEAVRSDYVQVAVTILQESDEDNVNPALREWAADLLRENSPTELADELYSELKSGSVTLPSEQFISRANTSNNGVLAVSSDGEAVTLLLDLTLDLQGSQAFLHDSKTVEFQLMLNRDAELEINSITGYLLGYLYMSENSRASIRVQAGSHTTQIYFPDGSMEDIEFENGVYDGEISREIDIPIDWSVTEAESMLFPITITITAERKNEDDYVLLAVDLLDAEVVVDARN